jgi:amino acid transporter
MLFPSIFKEVIMANPSPPLNPQTSHPLEPAPDTNLESGHLGRVPLVSLSLASFIPAVGMALLPVLMLSAAGPTAWTSALLTAVLVICIGLCVITFARRFVATGSLYSYIGEVFGPWSRYLVAASLIAGFVTQVGAIANGVGIFAGSFFANLGWTEALKTGPQLMFAVFAVAIAGAVAFRGLDASVRVAVTLAVISVPLMLIITIASAMHTGLEMGTQFNVGEFSAVGTLQGVASGAAWLIGFESSTSLAAETKDPRKNIPLAVMSVPVVLGIVYLLCTFLQVPGLMQVTAQLEAGISAPAALAEAAGLGAVFGAATDAILAIATFAALIGFVNYGARFLMTTGEDGLVPAWFCAVHPRFHSPYRAIIAMSIVGFGLLAGALVVSGDVMTTYATLSTLIVFCWIPPYVLICVGAVVLTTRQGKFRPLLAMSALVGGLGVIWIYVNSLISPPPAPMDAMSWISVLVIVGILAVLVIGTRSRRNKITDRQ